MKSQNKSVYTRRFNQLKSQLLSHFGPDVEVDETAVLRWGPETCLVAHDGSLGFTLYFRSNDGVGLGQFVEIVKTPYCSLGGLQGIHVQETDFNHLVDQIEVALRDNFERIYVRSVASLKQ